MIVTQSTFLGLSSPLNNDISNVTLYLSTYFDLQFDFDKAQIPQLMDWVNPWDVPSKTTGGTVNAMGGC